MSILLQLQVTSINFKKKMKKIKITRRLQLQATVKIFQFDLHFDLEGQHMLIILWFQRQLRTDKVNQTAQKTVKSSKFHVFLS